MTLQDYINLYLKLSDMKKEVRAVEDQIESKILTIIKNTKDNFATGIDNFEITQYPGEELKVFGEYWWHARGGGASEDFSFPAKWLDDNVDFMAEHNAILEKKKLAEEQHKEKEERKLYETLKKKYDS